LRGGRPAVRLEYKHTRLACYLSYITQSVLNSMWPLLFVTFTKDFGITLDQVALIITLNFCVQLLVDAVCVKIVDKIGYRASCVFAHLCCFIGFIGIGIFPYIMGNAYAGIILPTVIAAVGSGFIEATVSPVIEALPSGSKAASMSFLHSVFCWGCVGVILLSTLYFNLAGMENWRFLPMLWAVLPLFNMLFFTRVPLLKLVEDHKKIPLKKLFTGKFFLLFVVFMLCAGAIEQSMAQWASLFAESGLGVSKTAGDLLGPCAFAALMGISRTFLGTRRSNINLEHTLLVCGVGCLLSYALTIFSPMPVFSLVGCAMCGFFAGPMWPGTISLSAKRYSAGGTAMFAILAMGGHIEAALGPGIVGAVSGGVEDGAITFTEGWFRAADMTEAGLKTGLLAAVIFSIIFMVGILVVSHHKRKKKRLLQ